LGDRPSPSWYLDPLVAAQKRRLHHQLLRRWTDSIRPRSVLKTDVFEEAHGEDQILFDLLPEAPFTVGMDVALATASKASRRSPRGSIHFIAGDVRKLPFADGSIDLVLSTSTLDHFDAAEDFEASLKELVRITRSRGHLIITLDNAYNPTYYLLRWASRLRSAPFKLGYTASVRELTRQLQSLGVRVEASDTLIHNPRLISSALYTGVRRVLGRFADGPIRALLWGFALLDRLPTRWITGCFIAVWVVKPEESSR
jgi:ubiquinone/menaquinone biosynthesis C-methylase UbiE